jgi:hypothetical protein
MNVVNLPLHRITFPEPIGVGDVVTSAVKARISESIDLEGSLQMGCSVEARNTYVESKVLERLPLQ